MQPHPRNLRNEILVAIGAIGALTVAVIFAVVVTGGGLSVHMGATPVARASATVQSGVTTGIPAATLPPIIPAETVVSDTATTRPSTVQVATDTPLPTTPSGGKPSETAASGTTATSTLPPVPTRTPRPTSTPLLSLTPLPSATPTQTPSPVPPTHTPAPPLPTPVTLLPTPTPSVCLPPPGWLPYAVRPGDNLFRLSLRAGIALEQLQTANCIADAASITTGQIIYVPDAFFAPTVPPVTPFPSPTGIIVPIVPSLAPTSSSPLPPLVIGCLIPQVRITFPAPDAVLFNPFTVRGTAILSEISNFSFYKVEIRGQDQSNFANVALSSTPAYGPDDVLATIDPARFGPGVYQIRLTVVDVTGNFPDPCTIRVTFR